MGPFAAARLVLHYTADGDAKTIKHSSDLRVYGDMELKREREMCQPRN